jgi:hypothetical protein
MNNLDSGSFLAIARKFPLFQFYGDERTGRVLKEGEGPSGVKPSATKRLKK